MPETVGGLSLAFLERTGCAMKILLVAVNAKYIHSNLAVYSLQAYAREHLSRKIQIEIAEYTINHQMEDILAGIYRAKPDVLCFSCYIWNISCVQAVLEEYHKLCPNVPRYPMRQNISCVSIRR